MLSVLLPFLLALLVIVTPMYGAHYHLSGTVVHAFYTNHLLSSSQQRKEVDDIIISILQ